MIRTLANSSAFWQVALLPLLVIIWCTLPVWFVVLLPVQIFAVLVSRKGFFETSPYRWLILLVTQGVDRKRDTFDRRFAVFHPEMNFARFRKIYSEKRAFRATRGKLRIARDGEALVPCLGHLPPDAPYDLSRVDDFLAVPVSLTIGNGDYFALVITNQGGLGVGVVGDEYLVFRRQDSVSGNGPWTVILPRTATLRRLTSPASEPPLEIFGQLVGSVPRTPENS
ncbi:MAG: hypothetical protein AB7O52_04260 [Planctomycetota bacterium]